jgi:hypothetical protein
VDLRFEVIGRQLRSAALYPMPQGRSAGFTLVYCRLRAKVRPSSARTPPPQLEVGSGGGRFSCNDRRAWYTHATPAAVTSAVRA